MLGWQFARLRAKVRPFQDCPVWRIPQQSTVNRSPQVVVPAKRAHDPSSGQCASAWRRAGLEARMGTQG
eukprot:6100368-Prymnesium_polylepis.1